MRVVLSGPDFQAAADVGEGKDESEPMKERE
jgi:hypothetical protein